jgi:predicted ATPase/predicted Ser/Thr protein kinase
MTPGAVVADRFEIVRLAGAGGMGRVYRALDRLTGEPVALKVMHDARSREADRFAREARVLAELHHPGIVRYVAHGATPAGEPFLAMEWIDGEDLGQHLAHRRPSLGEVLALARRLAEALGAAHRQGVVHRDVKPSNVLLPGGDLGRARLLDFGIARLSHGAPALTRTGRMLGTPGYMAPEQASGGRDVDARADVFSLGCVLFEALAGRPAFQAEHPMAVLAKILLEEAPRLGEVVPAAPPPLEALIARMLAKDAAARPEDGDAVAAALAALGPLDDTHAPPSIVAPPSITVGERRLLSVLLVKRAPDPTAAHDTVAAWAPTMAGAEAISVAATLDGGPIARASAIAASFGGSLSPLAGGGVVVTLGGSGVATDLAAQAARCALALREVFAGEPMVLATGRAEIAGQIPVGELLDRAAARLVTAGAGALAIDEVTAALLGAPFEVGATPAGPVLLGAGVADDAGRTLLGKPTPCVGREREIASLLGLFDEVAGEPVARAALVTAVAGAGKSRLARELVQRVRARAGVEVWIGRGDPMRAGSPFGMIAPFLRRAAGIRDGEPLDARRDKLRARVARHVAAAAVGRVAEFLGELVGAPFDDTASVQLAAARRDAMVMADQIRRAFEDFLDAECAAGPVLIVLEDLHWGDLPTVTLLHGALRNLAERPLMVLALARPEVHDLFPKLWADLDRFEVHLGPLTRKAGERLVKSVLGEATPPDLAARLWERSGGNAFYLEELIRAVAEGKGEALPETVLAMVQARLEALDPEARRVLRAASVFGDVFWRGGLAALLGGAEHAGTVADHVADLEARELVVRHPESRFPGEIEHAFRHALVRDAAYAALTDADRALGHRLAGAFLEQSGEGDAMVLAAHAARGGDPARAARWYRRAAEQALEGNDLEAAIARAEHGVRCLGEAGEEDGERLGELRLLQAEAHRWLGQNAEAERRGFEALRLLPRGGPLWCKAAGDVGVAAGRLAHRAELEAVLAELESEAGAGPLSAAVATALGRTMISLFMVGMHDRADSLLARLDDGVRAAIAHDPAALGWFLRALGLAALYRGDSGAYLELMEAATASFTRAGDLRTACAQQVNIGFANVQLGRYEEAERVLRSMLVEAPRLGLTAIANGARNNLGIALARLGRLDEARAFEEEAAAAMRAQGDRRLWAGSLVYLATIHRLAGDLDAAERAARGALEVLGGTTSARAEAAATLAEVLLAQGRVPEALASAQEATTILGALGDKAESGALAPLIHAEALAAAGERDEARRALLAARERLLARAAKIADPTLRQSFLTAVPEHARTIALAEAWERDTAG